MSTDSGAINPAQRRQQDVEGTAMLRHDTRTHEAFEAMFMWRWREILEGDWEHDPDPGQVVVYGADPDDPAVQEEVADRLKDLRLTIAKRRARKYADELETYVTLCEASGRPVRLAHGEAALGGTTWLIAPEDAACFERWAAIGQAAQCDPCYPMDWPAGELAHELRPAKWLYDSGQRLGGMCATLRATWDLCSGQRTKRASMDYRVFRAWLERRALADALASLQAGGAREATGALRIAYVRSFVEEYERVYDRVMSDRDWRACFQLTTQGDATQQTASEQADAASFPEEPLRFSLADGAADTTAPASVAHAARVSAIEPEEGPM